LKAHDDGSEYMRITIKKSDNTRKGQYIHRLVAQTYLPNPENFSIVNHKDGNPKNNHISNLEWVTTLGNNLHAIETGLHKTKSVLKIDRETGEILESFSSARKAAESVGKDPVRIFEAIYNVRITGNAKWRYQS